MRGEPWVMPAEDELLKRLDSASKSGSVTATKLLLEELRRRDGNDDSSFDRLDGENVTPIRSYGS
jgi:hypothetical protein